MALAPLSQTLVLTADGSNFPLTDAVVIPIGAIAPPPTFTVAPSISPSSGTTATTFTANDGTVEDGIVTGRRWLLSGNLIGTGTTVKPSTSGSLILEVSALGTGGVTTAKSAAVTVAAIPAPAFSGNPTISPDSGTTAATYTATDPTVSNGTITLRQWLMGTTVLGTGATIVPGPGNSGSLTRKVTALGTDGSTITVTSAGVTVAAVTLQTLTVSVSSGTVGQAISSTISGLTSGSRIELTGAGAAGLSINGAVITGTPTAAGPVYVVETLAGATNSPRTSSALITVAEPAATPTNTYANSTRVYANNASFSPDLLDVEQRLVALGSRFTQYRVDYGSGPNTATGDTVYAALVKLQNWIAAIEADRAATQDNTMAGDTKLLAGNAAWKTRFQDLETRFTALGVA